MLCVYVCTQDVRALPRDERRTLEFELSTHGADNAFSGAVVEAGEKLLLRVVTYCRTRVYRAGNKSLVLPLCSCCGVC